MPDEMVWKVGNRSGVPASEPPKEKVPYVALQRTNDKMTDSQKEGVRVWNLMVSTLREHGLMEEKKEGA